MGKWEVCKNSLTFRIFFYRNVITRKVSITISISEVSINDTSLIRIARTITALETLKRY